MYHSPRLGNDLTPLPDDTVLTITLPQGVIELIVQPASIEIRQIGDNHQGCMVFSAMAGNTFRLSLQPYA
jgi:hypothetical protein